jgi:protein-tyrosine phosphatase
MGVFMKPKAILLVLAMLVSGCAGDEGGTDASYQDGGIQPPQCERRVLEDDVTNAREIGGYALTAGGFVDCGKIMRGGHLSGLSADGCQEFSDLGIKTVVDLRMESERTQLPEATCVTDQATVIDATLPKLDPSADNYVALLGETGTVAAVFATLGESSSYPVYVHCMIGRDRASTMTALVLMALGVPDQTVVDEFDLNNDAGVSVDTDYIQAVIDEVKSRGGIEAYLTSAGVTSGQVEILRSEAIKSE